MNLSHSTTVTKCRQWGQGWERGSPQPQKSHNGERKIDPSHGYSVRSSLAWCLKVGALPPAWLLILHLPFTSEVNLSNLSNCSVSASVPSSAKGNNKSTSQGCGEDTHTAINTRNLEHLAWCIKHWGGNLYMTSRGGCSVVHLFSWRFTDDGRAIESIQTVSPPSWARWNHIVLVKNTVPGLA